MIKVEYHYDPQVLIWIYCVVRGADDVIQTGSDVCLYQCAVRAMRCVRFASRDSHA